MKRFDSEAFAVAIGKRLEKEGLSLRSAGPVMGLDWQVIQRFMSHRTERVQIEHVIPICEWLKLPIGRFITSKGDRKRR